MTGWYHYQITHIYSTWSALRIFSSGLSLIVRLAVTPSWWDGKWASSAVCRTNSFDKVLILLGSLLSARQAGQWGTGMMQVVSSVKNALHIPWIRSRMLLKTSHLHELGYPLRLHSHCCLSLLGWMSFQFPLDGRVGRLYPNHEQL